jgi:hypothetical protein
MNAGSGGLGGAGGMSADASVGVDASTGGDAATTDAAVGGEQTFDPADHCGPGTYTPPEAFGFSDEPDHATNCTGDDFRAAAEAGVIEGTPEVRAFIRSVELTTPMMAGEPYAMSFEVDFEGLNGAMALELWGTNARCGLDSTATLLSDSVLVPDKQTVCADLTPAAAYSHVLLVLRDQDDVFPEGRQTIILQGATFCSAGACP